MTVFPRGCVTVRGCGRDCPSARQLREGGVAEGEGLEDRGRRRGSGRDMIGVGKGGLRWVDVGTEIRILACSFRFRDGGTRAVPKLCAKASSFPTVN